MFLSYSWQTNIVTGTNLNNIPIELIEKKSFDIMRILSQHRKYATNSLISHNFRLFLLDTSLIVF